MSTAEVVESIRAFGRTHREHRLIRDDVRRQNSERLSKYTTDLEWICRVDERSGEELHEAEYTRRVEAVRQYLTTGVDSEGALPAVIHDHSRGATFDVATALAEAYEALTLDRSTGAAALQPTRNSLVGLHRTFVLRLREWFTEARSGSDTLSGWPEILREWRRAVDLTTRNAAEVLEVSPSTVVRYEQGERSPASPYVAALIDQIDERGPIYHDDELVTATRAPAARTTSAMEDLLDPIEQSRRQDEELRVQIEDALPHIGQLHLLVLAELTQRPDLLDSLIESLRSDPLGPLRQLIRT